MILAGDVGGTKTHLALFEPGDERPVRSTVRTFRSREQSGVVEMVHEFLGPRTSEVHHAAFGVPGPVRGGRARLTNLPWVVDADELAEALGVDEVRLANDLEANAWAIGVLRDDEIEILQAGDPDPEGHAALMSPGTGLGEACLFRLDGRLHPTASEGGHADFSPWGRLQTELHRSLQEELGRVEWEHVLSGPGLVNVHRFVHGQDADRASRCEVATLGDVAPEVSRDGLDRSCPCCTLSLDVFAELYGAEAGNLALKVQATAGVYVGGGIAPKILPALRGDGFLRAFGSRGGFSGFMERIPVRVILNSEAALLGAAVLALGVDR